MFLLHGGFSSILRYAPKTGVRTKGNVTSVQSSILRPLRQFLDEHIAREGVPYKYTWLDAQRDLGLRPPEQPLMAMLSLQVGLDRIDGALQTLDL